MEKEPILIRLAKILNRWDTLEVDIMGEKRVIQYLSSAEQAYVLIKILMEYLEEEKDE